MAVFSYFWARTDKDLSTCLYLCTSINDATFSSMVIFVAASFFNNRSQTLFGTDTVCLLWGFVYRVIQKMAMFLTGTLSIARTLSLVFPLMTIKRKLVLMVVGAYLGLTLIYDITMTGLFLKFLHFIVLHDMRFERHFISVNIALSPDRFIFISVLL